MPVPQQRHPISEVSADKHSPLPIRRTLLRTGKKFNLEILTTTSRDGTPIERECVRHPGAVIILPILAGAQPQVILIRNFRLSLETSIFELPAGTRTPGEAPAECAARELEEETGYRAGRLSLLGKFYTSPGLSDELMWAFVATELAPVPQRLELDEFITVHPTPVGDVMAMIARNELEDAKSMLALLWARQAGHI
jgi:ADP-ribose pyrophosphatase